MLIIVHFGEKILSNNDTSSVLTVYILENDDEFSTFHRLMQKYPSIVLENTRKTSAGINVGIRQKGGESSDIENFKRNLQIKLKKKRMGKNSFLHSIKKILGLKI